MSVQSNVQPNARADVDPVTLEIFKNAMESYADEMALILLRSAYSPIVRDTMDYSTAVCDSKGRMVAQGLTNPIHLGSFPRVMKNLMALHGDTLCEGDGFLVNDPYDAGGMHLPDIFFIRPVFTKGNLVGFTTALVHHTDIGGMTAGSMALNAEEIFQEGVRIPIIKLFDKGVANQAVFDLMKANSRVPEELMGDLRAQISSCDTVAKSLAELADTHGDNYEILVEELHNYAERLTRHKISEFPDGVYTGEDYIDGLGEKGALIKFKVAITISGDEISFDWDGTSDQVKGSINCPITTTWSLAYAALRCVLGPDIPNCEGYMRPISVVAPLGCVVNPRPYAACAARGVTAYRMLDTSFSALGKVMPGLVPAGGEGGPTAITFSGTDPESYKQWLITDGILGSWGGRRDFDGIEGISNPGTNISNQPIELIESRLPLRVTEYGYVKNSGGAGRRRGGLAMIRSYEVLCEKAGLTLRSDRRAKLPIPLEGGLPGSPSISFIERAEGAKELLPTMNMGPKEMRNGDALVHIAAGGAGFGSPLDRPAEEVLNDVLDGLVDAHLAMSVYGVVIDGKTVDKKATENARAALSKEDTSALSAAQFKLFLKAAGSEELME